MLKHKLATVVDSAKNHATALRLSCATALMAVGPTICAFAAEGDVSAGNNLLTGETMTIISSGFNDLKVTAVAVIALSIGAAMGVIGISAASKYATKKAKGVLNQAS